MNDEIREEIKILEDEFKNDIDKIIKSTETNVRNLMAENRGIFKARINCGICLAEKEINDYSKIQASANQWFISADMLNKVLGFAPDFKKIEELTVLMGKTSDMVQRDKIAKEIYFLKNNYAALPFVCLECATKLQNEFIKVFDKMILENLNKETIPDDGKPLSTNLFCDKGVSQEEKQMITAQMTIEV